MFHHTIRLTIVASMKLLPFLRGVVITGAFLTHGVEESVNVCIAGLSHDYRCSRNNVQMYVLMLFACFLQKFRVVGSVRIFAEDILNLTNNTFSGKRPPAAADLAPTRHRPVGSVT